MRFLHNLASTVTYPGTPWAQPDLTIPDEVREDKKKRDVWINNPHTKHCVYSTWEALNSNLRLKKPEFGLRSDDNEDNPPHYCYGVVADFDAVLGQDEVASAFTRLAPLIPSYYGTSLSGKVHLIWLFERPLLITSFALATLFLELVETKLRLRDALPSFDASAFVNCARYYTSGGSWFQIAEQPLSYALGLGWLIEASSKINYKEQAYVLPMPIVHEQLLKDPRFADHWSDIDFNVGAQGPTWWIEGSESPKSAIVKDSGMWTFASHAVKNFYPWGDLIGYSFVDQYKSTHVGLSVTGTYFDGRQFWREISRGDWKAFSKDDIMHYLRVSRNLKERPNKGEKNSELALAYEFIIDHHNIEGAAPFVFKPSGVITVNARPFLNTHTARVVAPVDHKVEWGHPDQFPTISKFLGYPSTASTDEAAPRFFKGGSYPLDTFISWLSYFYKSAYNLALVSGHNLFLCGPVGVGKSFLNRLIVGSLFNGFREAGEYLAGNDNFGAELFAVALWVVDDGTTSTSLAAHKRWSEMLKRMAANSTFRYHEKFRTPQQVDWSGRVFTTLNDDEESTRQIPDMERAILDKIMLFRATDRATINFPERGAVAAILAQELPYFARFLLDWVVPERCVLRGPDSNIDYRFGGIKPWHDPHLMRNANQTSPSSGFFESLEDWKQEYFRVINEGKKQDDKVYAWRGSAFQLRKQLAQVAGNSEMLHRMDNNYVSRMLAHLKLKGYPIESEDDGDIKYWIIHLAHKPNGARSAHFVRQTTDSRFQIQ